jgi:PAS domain S-box-containing protein
MARVAAGSGLFGMSFRLKLLLAMMLLVVGVTATTLLITENQVRLSYERHFQQSFKFQLRSFLQQRQARLEPIEEKVAEAATSSRLLAPMEIAGQPHADKHDIDDLYQNGFLQLSDLIGPGGAGRTNAAGGFYFFLNTRNEVVYPSRELKLPFTLPGLRDLTAQVEAVGAAVVRGDQPQVGYLAPEDIPGSRAIREMIFTPIVDQVAHQKLGVLAVGFSLPSAGQDSPVLSAIWLDNRLYASALPGGVLKQVEQAVWALLHDRSASWRDFTVEIAGVPHQVYCQALATGPAFPPAYQVNLYSLADALAENHKFGRKILFSGTIGSLCALVLSWLISRSLAVPLQELVTGTSQIEHGNYSAKVPERGGDEMGRLAHAFNSMAGRIQASHAALEKRIAERTHELAERKRAEEALRKSEASLREAQRIAHLGNWDWDVTNNELRWSEEIFAIFGLSAGEFGGTYEAFLERVHPGDRDKVEQSIRQSLKTGKPYSLEHRLIRPDGEIRIVHEQAEVLVDQAGASRRMVGTVQDVSEQKRIEAEFLRAQRMDSIGALAGGMAHDLNNALSPILMGIHLIRRKARDAEVDQMLAVMEANTHRGADMVRQVLTFARGREGDRELLDVGRLLREMEHICRQTLPKTIVVSALAPKDLWPMMGNSTQLHQVLLNLCINARDAMPKGGHLTLAADNVTLTEPEAADIPQAAPGSYVMVFVSDTGTGIAPEILPQIFQPFFTTKGLGQGTGLGLSTIARIVRNHGGFVSVKSQVDVGTTFEVYFPRAETATTPPTSMPAAQPPRGQGEFILLLEDDRSVREMVGSSLVEYGYRVVSAGSGAEASTLLSQHQRELRLILTVPVLKGMVPLEVIRARCPHVPVILMSGEIQPPGRQPLAGPVAFLSKPFPSEQLLTTVANELKRQPRQQQA